MNRRRFIRKSSAVSLATLGFSSTVTASSTGQSLEEAGIKNAFYKLFQNGKLDRAEELLKNHSVTHQRSTIPAGAKQTSDDVSTDLYSRSKAVIDLYVTHAWDNFYTAGLYWTLYVDEAVDVPGPNDGVGISYPGDRWGYEPRTAETGEYTSKVDPNPEGVIAQFDDSGAYNNQGELPNNSYFQIQLEKQESGKHNVYGHYGHTYYGQGIGWGGVGFSITAGSIGINFDGEADKWKKPSNTVEI